MRTVVLAGGLVLLTSALARAQQCAPIAGATSLLRPGTAVMLGEVHGTEQAPSFLGDLACAAVTQRIAVTIALELPLEANAPLDQYLTTRDAATRARAYEAIFNSTWQDGRRSKAIAALVERARRLRQSKKDVRVVAYSDDSASSGQLRDRGMAVALGKAFADSTRLLLVLSGNLHNRLRVGTAISSTYEPAGFLLEASAPGRRIVSLDMASDSGTVWTCQSSAQSSCQVRSMRTRGSVPPWSIVFADTLDANGYHGRFGVGAVRASLPAISK
jgi:hypothetical protein